MWVNIPLVPWMIWDRNLPRLMRLSLPTRTPTPAKLHIRGWGRMMLYEDSNKNPNKTWVYRAYNTGYIGDDTTQLCWDYDKPLLLGKRNGICLVCDFLTDYAMVIIHGIHHHFSPPRLFLELVSKHRTSKSKHKSKPKGNNSTPWPGSINVGKYNQFYGCGHWGMPFVRLQSFASSQGIHGTGMFTYIYHKNQPFM